MRRLGLSFVAFGSVIVSSAFLVSLVNYRQCATCSLERATGIVTRRGDPTSQIEEIITALKSCAEPHPIFVGAQRHDRVFANAIAIYFLSGRLSGTYFHHFDPGITTTEAVQRRIISDLVRNQVNFVVIWNYELPDEPNRSRVSSGVTLLDDFLKEHFRATATSERYTILRRQAA